jgi:hypothetical protein
MQINALRTTLELLFTKWSEILKMAFAEHTGRDCRAPPTPPKPLHLPTISLRSSHSAEGFEVGTPKLLHLPTISLRSSHSAEGFEVGTPKLLHLPTISLRSSHSAEGFEVGTPGGCGVVRGWRDH